MKRETRDHSQKKANTAASAKTSDCAVVGAFRGVKSMYSVKSCSGGTRAHAQACGNGRVATRPAAWDRWPRATRPRFRGTWEPMNHTSRRVQHTLHDASSWQSSRADQRTKTMRTVENRTVKARTLRRPRGGRHTLQPAEVTAHSTQHARGDWRLTSGSPRVWRRRRRTLSRSSTSTGSRRTRQGFAQVANSSSGTRCTASGPCAECRPAGRVSRH